MEADLARWYHIDYRDRWRYDESGRPLLPLRRLKVLVEHLPSESAVAAVSGTKGWGTTELLLSDLLKAWTDEHHPNDPRFDKPDKKQSQPTPAAKMREARSRSQERRQRLGIKGSVLRKRQD